MRNRLFIALIAALSIGVIGQAQQQAPKDDAYVSSHLPQLPVAALDARFKDDPLTRREAAREQFGGDLTPEFIEALMSAANEQAALYGPAGRGNIKPATGGEWTNIGPDRSDWIQNGVRVNESDTGRVRTFLIHPTNADIVYVLKSSGGLWKTTNFSAPRPAWRPMSDNVLSTSGGNAAFGRDPDTIFLASGDPFDPGVGGYIYRSSNGGEAWSPAIKLGASTVVPAVKVDSNGASDVVLAGTNAGLFRSADGGDTYAAAPVLSGLVWSLQQTSAGWLAARTTGAANVGSILLSTDRGATWAPIPNAGAVYSGAGRTTLGVGAPGDAIVYAFAATAGNGAQKDLFRSTDGGLNWTALGLGGKVPVNPNEDQPDMNIMAGQAFYNHMLLIDPNDLSRNTVFIGGQLSSAKSTDGGATWRLISNWLAQFRLPYVHADHHAAAFTMLKGVPIMLFGTDGGVFVSDDGGQTFSSQKNDGMSSYLIYAMTGNPKHPDDVFIGLQDNGTRWRVGPTGTYNQVLGGDGFGVAWSQADDLVSLASVYYSYIVRNDRTPSNTQNKWDIGWDGIAEFFNPAQTYFNTSLATPRATADPAGLTFFHRTRFKLYRTTNGAVSWNSVLNTTPVLLRAGSHPIGISPDDLNHFGVLGNGGNLWFTTDGGATFQNKVLLGVAGGWPGFNSTLAYAANSTMYIGNEAPIGTAMRAIKSTDGGNTWTNVSTGLPPVPVTKLLVSTRDATGKTVYAATWIGVYETTDSGASWHLYGTGLPTVNVSDIYMPTDGSYLRVSTYGRGVWETRF
jgi:photosystem II stability/assembly factor-like uncharacterized protein